MRDGWTDTTIEEVAQVIGGGTPRTREPSYWGGDVLWITPSEITQQEGQVITSTERMITQLGLEKSSAKLLPPHTVLLTSRATIGAVAMAGVEMATNQGFASLVPDQTKVVPEFLMYWCQAHRHEFEKRAGGNTFKEVSKSSVSSVALSLPPLEEQRRIVDFISSIDAAIEAARRLSMPVEPLWQALVHTETVELELTSLDEMVATAKAGGTPSRKRLEFYGGDIPWLKSGEVDNGGIRAAEESITAEGLSDSSAWLVPQDSVLVAMYGATAGAVGYLDTPMATNQAVLALRGRPDRVDQRFLFHWLRSRTSAMKARATGAAQPNLSKTRVLEEKFPAMPLPNQRKVAHTLDGVLEIGNRAEEFLTAARQLRSEVLSEVLSGAHEIPDSYDRFLEEAS